VADGADMTIVPAGPATVASASELSRAQKAALVLAQIGPERAAQVLQRMDEDEVAELARAMASLPQVPVQVVRQVLNECLVDLQRLHGVRQGGLGPASRLLRNRLGSARASEVIEQLGAQTRDDPLAPLHHLEPQQITSFLVEELPQTIAVVVSHLPAPMAAEVLCRFPEPQRSQIAYRVAKLSRVAPVALETLAATFEDRLEKAAHPALLQERDGPSVLASMLQHVQGTVERQVLGALEEQSPEIAEAVRAQLFTFEDMLRLDDRSLQKVLRSVPPKELAVALRGAEEAIVERIRRNLSERSAEDLEEEIWVLGPTRRSQVESARQEVVRVVRELEAAGEIVVPREGEQLV